MAQSRQLLQTILEELLGSSNVYFQPPPSVQMQYPAIVYNRDLVDSKFANNFPYQHDTRYQVTVITEDPDSLLPDLVGNLPKCLFSRFFAAGNLNHDVFQLYF